MLLRRRSAMDSLSVSALDLFASAVGVFILMFLILLPFYLKQPSIQEESEAASAMLTQAQDQRAQAESSAEDTREELESSTRQLKAAAARAEALEEKIRQSAASLAAAEAEQATRKPAPAAQTNNRIPGGVISIEDLDLVIVMDATGSMGNELAEIRANLSSITRILNRLSPNLRMGFVAYRDRDAPPIIRAFELTPMSSRSFREISGFVGRIAAKGGGDPPEPVDQALKAAIDMNWRPDAKGRIIVIGDAPAHIPNWSRSMRLASEFQSSGPEAGSPFDRSVSTILTGGGPQTKRFFTELANAGGGQVSTHRGAIIESVLLSVLHE